MSHRSPARPNYPGNRKEGEVSTQHPPKPHDAETVKKSVGWDELKHGPELHEDQHSHGKGGMDGWDEHKEAARGHDNPRTPGTIGHNPESHQNDVESRKDIRHWKP